MSNPPICGVAEPTSFKRCTGNGSLDYFKAYNLPQTPAFISVKTSLYSVYVLGLFSSSFILFFGICSFVQYLSDTGLMVVYSSDVSFCVCK